MQSNVYKSTHATATTNSSNYIVILLHPEMEKSFLREKRAFYDNNHYDRYLNQQSYT